VTAEYRGSLTLATAPQTASGALEKPGAREIGILRIPPLISICVYCGSSPGRRPSYAAAARATGEALARLGARIIYGGGEIGLMGAMADAAIAAGGEVIGVIPQSLLNREAGHHRLQTLHVVRNMHERKAMMTELSDAFLALPGGWGTLEELCEMLAWSKLGFHLKPIALLNVEGYFDGLLKFAEHMAVEGFVNGAPAEVMCIDADAARLAERLMSKIEAERSAARR